MGGFGTFPLPSSECPVLAFESAPQASRSSSPVMTTMTSGIASARGIDAVHLGMAHFRIEVHLHPLDQTVPIDINQQIVPTSVNAWRRPPKEIRQERPGEIIHRRAHRHEGQPKI